MKKIVFHVLSIFLASTFTFYVVQDVFAHGGETRLEISVERTNPGGAIDVRGVDFEPEETLMLTLVGPQQTIALGEVITDPEGIFLQTVMLPPDLPEGTYAFVVMHDEVQISSPSLTVQGTAMMENSDGQRAEEDGLLAPMPTAGLNPVTKPGGSVSAAAEPIARPPYGWFAVIVLISAGVILLWSLRQKRTG